MNRANKVLFWVIAVLVVILIALAIWQFAIPKSEYSAVYLRTGDLYFGKLTTFPSFSMKNVYTLQLTNDETNPVRVQKFTDVFWGPEDWIKINKDEVVWHTNIVNDGQLATLLKTNPNLLNQNPVEQQQIVPEETE